MYAYCDSCGKTAILSEWDKRMPRLRNCPGQQEICAAMESCLLPRECGGRFRKGGTPRCFHCKHSLSAGAATSYIEAIAPGAKKGWRWQRNLERHVLHCHREQQSVEQLTACRSVVDVKSLLHSLKSKKHRPMCMVCEGFGNPCSPEFLKMSTLRLSRG